ncbi:MAG: CAP domain-containing protein [Chloroflexi bacterium]|nr:CAP domain-containing protein [Chloroflexota bacterium]
MDTETRRRRVLRPAQDERGSFVRLRMSGGGIAFCLLPPAFRLLPAGFCLLVFALALAPPASASEGADWEVPAGRYYLQTGGYEVADRDGIPFWSEFQRLGGVVNVGYPVSRRFLYKGFAIQAFQKAVLQWQPDAGQAVFLNVFDELSGAGKDGWLYAARSTPPPVQLDERGKSWDEIAALRLALLDGNPAIREAYLSASDPIQERGLPTSRVEDLGPLYALRAQRAVIQQWKVDTAWARAGEVVLANGGDLAKEAGLFPSAALATEQASADPPALARINAYRTAMGLAPARLNPALLRSASSHVAYYEANRGDPSLSGMGLHREQPGAAGFTGASIGDRARAAGYRSGGVTENAGWGPLERAVDWYLDTVNHRLPLIHPSALDLGYAISPLDGFHIIDVALSQGKLAVALPSVYPVDGATDVPIAWDGAETPDPAPGLPRPLGYPLTVAFGATQRVAWKAFELRAPSGASVPIATPLTPWMRAAALIPLRPLEPGQTYTARIEALVDGKPARKEWQFSTRRQ